MSAGSLLTLLAMQPCCEPTALERLGLPFPYPPSWTAGCLTESGSRLPALTGLAAALDPEAVHPFGLKSPVGFLEFAHGISRTE